jgi:hypothetical protein
MKSLALPLIFGLLFSLNTSAQKPFRFKLIAYFEDISDFSIHTDTLYFGCDNLGGEGYQDGLDILDTVMKPNSWYVVDTIIKKQLNLNSSLNTKKNIKNFGFNKGIGWQTYFNSTLVAIKCDTNELIYNESKKALLGVGISCYGCSIGVWHSESGSLGPIRWYNGIPYFYQDSIAILESSNEIKVSLFMIDSMPTGVDKTNNDIQLLTENPVNENLQIHLNNRFSGQLVLTDVIGNTNANWAIEQATPHSLQLDFKSIKSGFYYLMFIPHNPTYNKSVIKIVKK